MRIDFNDGSFMLSWQKCIAWYDPNGALKDAEYKLSPGRTRAVSVKHVHVRAWLEKQGKSQVVLLNRGILKRKTG